VREVDGGCYHIRGNLGDAIRFAQECGTLQHTVQLLDVELSPKFEFCLEEHGPDVIEGYGKVWVVNPTNLWSWDVRNRFHFKHEEDATAFALRFL
jgi:hypothetical protein